MKFASKFTLALAAIASVASFASAASADTGHWAQRNHHRHEVVLREHHHLARIRDERRHELRHIRRDEHRDEVLAHRDARALRATNHAIARQEHAAGRDHGGPVEQR